MIRLRSLCMIFLAVFGCWIANSCYHYFFDRQNPIITLSGLDQDGCYAGALQAQLVLNKPGYISLLIDDKPLVQSAYVNGQDPYHFTLSTEQLSAGYHTLKAVAVDRRYHKNSTNFEVAFQVDNCPLSVTFLKENHTVLQGRTLHVIFKTNKEIANACVKTLTSVYPVFPEQKNMLVYEAFIPIACEEKAQEHPFSLQVTDRAGKKVVLDNTFRVDHVDFKKQTIAVSAQKMAEEKEKGRAMADLEARLALLAEKSPQQKLWKGSFCTPIEIDRVTCEFGTIRTTQERGRYAHNALDIINKPKSVVWSTQAGVVALKDRFDFSGNTVVVDHGCGVLSMFYHLDDFADIEIGQKIAKGNPVGTLGKTGYATGYHLHWEMRVGNVQVDPMQWTEDTF